MDSNAPTPSQSNNGYDPIKMLRDFMDDNPDSPGFFKNFLINRLGDQLVWYDKRSGKYKKSWQRNKRLIIILSASIPFLVGLIGQNPIEGVKLDVFLQIIVGGAGVIIAVMEGFNALYKNQELYINYRLTAEKLKQEFSLFLGKAGEYAIPEPNSYMKLVANVEAIISSENNDWAELARKNERNAMSSEVEKMVEEYLEKYGYGKEEGSNGDEADG